MQRTTPIAALLAAGLLCGIVAAQPPNEAPEELQLDERIRRALARSPELRLAEAELARARAQLAIARDEVIARVLEAERERKQLEHELRATVERLRSRMKLHEMGRVETGEVQALEAEVAHIKLALEHHEVREAWRREGKDRVVSLDDVTPRPVGLDDVTPRSPQGMEKPPREDDTPTHPEIEKKLDARISVPTDALSTRDFWKFLQGASGISILVDNQVRDDYEDEGTVIRVPLEGKHRVEDILHAVTDLTDLVFVLRPYGLFVTYSGDARNYDTRTIPKLRRRR